MEKVVAWVARWLGWRRPVVPVWPASQESLVTAVLNSIRTKPEEWRVVQRWGHWRRLAHRSGLEVEADGSLWSGVHTLEASRDSRLSSAFLDHPDIVRSREEATRARQQHRGQLLQKLKGTN